MKNVKLFINGAWQNGTDTITTLNPSTGEAFGTVPQATKAEVNAAVTSARKALGKWSAMPVEKRAEILGKAVDLLVEAYGQQGEETELKRLIMDEMGKRLPEADIEVIETSDMLAYFVKNAAELLKPKTIGLNTEMWATKKSVMTFEPVGVVAVIKAWNYPLEIPIWALAPALVAGNTVVFKPSEKSSFVGMEIVKIFEKAGLPKGVLNLITGDGKVGKFLVESKGIDMVSFTGSQKVGTSIGVSCAKRHLKYSLELGGNDAAIVDKDADLELASNGLVWGAFCNSGQVCVGVKRALVHKDIAETLTSKIVEKAKSLHQGKDYGAIVSSEQLAKIEAFVADAVEKGGVILTGGKRTSGKGNFYPPTVISNVSTSMKLMKEECFGILLPIVVVNDMKEAIKIANDTDYGLGASVWSSNSQNADEIAQQLKVGSVWVNDVNVAFPEAPWVGIKKSGPGIDLSEWGLYEYVNKKHTNIETSDENRRVWWYPYE